MTSKGRYTLVVENEYKNLIPISNNNNIKVDLASFDRYTTKFSTPQQLIEDLKNRQIIIKGYRTMYISYRAKKAEQKLEIAFSEHEQLSRIARKSNSKVNINSSEFDKFLNTLLTLLDNNSFYEFLLKQKVNDMYVLDDKSRLKDYLDERYSLGKNDKLNTSGIKKHMSSYKKFRDIYLVVNEYNKKFERLFDFLDNPNFYKILLSSKKIGPQTQECIRDYLNNLSAYFLSEIKKQLTYSELEEVEYITDVFQEKEQAEEELLEQKKLKEKYPEAYVEHKMNPYSSYEEEKEYEQYMNSLMDEQVINSKEKQKVKKLRKKQVDPRQLTFFDKFEK